jgi:hypothetical protein
MRFIIGNKRMTLMKFLTFFILIFILGCGPHLGEVWYSQIKDKDKFISKDYSANDTIYLKYYAMGTWLGPASMKRRASEQLDFSKDTVWGNIVAAMNRTNLPFKISDNPTYIEIPDLYYQRIDSAFVKEYILKVRSKEDTDKTIIVPLIRYSSVYMNEINAGLTAGSISPSGKLEHTIWHLVSLCVLKDDELMYFSAAGKRDTLTRNPSEPYRYHFPQELWDTLVYMSTRDYVERMR